MHDTVGKKWKNIAINNVYTSTYYELQRLNNQRVIFSPFKIAISFGFYPTTVHACSIGNKSGGGGRIILWSVQDINSIWNQKNYTLIMFYFEI